jgi:hypothetical protein
MAMCGTVFSTDKNTTSTPLVVNAISAIQLKTYMMARKTRTYLGKLFIISDSFTYWKSGNIIFAS